MKNFWLDQIEIVKIWSDALLLKQGQQHYFWMTNGHVGALGQKITIDENGVVCRHDGFFFQKDLEDIRAKGQQIYCSGVCYAKPKFDYLKERLGFMNFDYMED